MPMYNLIKYSDNYQDSSATVSYSGSLLHNLNKYIANILNACVKHENNNTKNSTTFPNYIRNVRIEDEEIMVSFSVTSLCTNIPIIDTLNIIKNSVHSDDEFARKTSIPQDFLIYSISF